MKWVTKWSWGLLAGLSLWVPAALAYEDHDRQLHVDAAIGGKLDGGFEVGLVETLKYSNQFNEFYELETSLILNWTATHWLKLGVGYKEVNTRVNKERFSALEEEGMIIYRPEEDHFWVRETRPYGQAELKGKLAGWKLSDRNRFEWRDKEWRGAYLRYRNRLKAVAPWQWTSWKVAPFASVEIFFEDDDLRASSDRLDRTRWTVGFTMNPIKHLVVSPALFLERNKKIGVWTDISVLQLSAGLKF